jgi:hypothetical protein
MMECQFRSLIEIQIKLLEVSAGGAARTLDLRWSADARAPSASLTLEIEYCARSFKWLVDCHQQGVDLTPLDSGLSMDQTYGIFTFESTPCLATWTPNNPRGLVEIEAELRDTFTKHQKQLIEEHPNKRYLALQRSLSSSSSSSSSFIYLFFKKVSSPSSPRCTLLLGTACRSTWMP